jgi:hypothetical protein
VLQYSASERFVVDRLLSNRCIIMVGKFWLIALLAVSSLLQFSENGQYVYLPIGVFKSVDVACVTR